MALNLKQNITRAKKMYRFFGRRVTFILGLCALSGLTLSVLEYVFAFSLQAFLLVLGVTNPERVHLPNWVPQSELVHVLLFLFFVGAFKGIFRLLELYLSNSVQERFKHLQRHRLLSWVYKSRSASSAAVLNLFSERSTLAGYSLVHLTLILTQGTLAVFLLGYLFYLSAITTIALLGTLAIFLLPLKLLSRRTKIAGKSYAGEWEKINRRLLMGIKNLLLIRLYGMEKKEQEASMKSLDKYLDNSLFYSMSNGIFAAAPQIIGVGLVCVVAYFIKTDKIMDTGILVSYFYLFVRFLQSGSELGKACSSVVFRWPQVMELAKWWADHSVDSDRGSKKYSNRKEIEAEINVDNAVGLNIQDISFRYDGEEEYLFKDFSLDVKAGSAAVIIGSSGVGKSTLTNLILGELEPSKGGINVKWDSDSYAFSDVRSRILSKTGYVGADSFLVEGTVYENLIYGLDEAPSETDVKHALSLAECGFIDTLSDGVNAMITEQGQGLSAGQKQRLGLARALLRRPKLLILDEATANLDTKTELQLVSTLEKLKGELTIVAVTHRDALLKIADQVVEL